MQGMDSIPIFSKLESYMEDRRRHRSCILRPCSRALAPKVLDAYAPQHMDPTSLAAAGLVLLLLYLTGRFLWRYNKDAAQAHATAGVAASPTSSTRRAPPAAAAGAAASSLPAASPLPRLAVPLSSSSSSSSSMLPVFFVLHVRAPNRPGAERAAECAVCLAEFGEREAGRLLPWCGHAFHEECIATWLRVSTTCPLCRTSVATK